MPEGCLPASTVPTIFGGFCFRSTTKTRLSGTFFHFSPSGSAFTEFATRANSPDGWIARLTGGPVIVFCSGIVAATTGASGFEISTTESVSCPGSR